MTKIEQILSKYNLTSESSYLDNLEACDIIQMMKEYAEWYAKKCIEELQSGRCIVEIKELAYLSTKNNVKRIIKLPKHE